MLRLLIFVAAILFVLLYELDAAASERQDIIKMIRTSAVEHGIEPDLAVAIAVVESGLNPNAVGDAGEIGLFQLRPEYHRVKPGDVKNNIDVAMKYLGYLKSVCGPKYRDAWIICYNLGPNYPRDIQHPNRFPYYIKVKRKILLASY